MVVSDSKTGKSEVLEAKDSTAQLFLGRRIGDTVDLTAVGQAYKVKITGGSDKAGFPMRADILTQHSATVSSAPGDLSGPEIPPLLAETRCG